MGTEHAHDHSAAAPSLNRSAFAATWHCLTGCAIGEILGLVIATALGWGNAASIAIAIVLAFFFGYSQTLRPLVTSGVPLGRAARIALAADTVSITVMEIVDNGFVLLVLERWRRPWRRSLLVEPGHQPLHGFLGGLSREPRTHRGRGRGHAVVHAYHSPVSGTRAQLAKAVLSLSVTLD